MKTIRAGAPGSTEIIMVTNELRPSNIKQGTQPVGSGLRVQRIASSLANVGAAIMKAYGNLPDAVGERDITVEISNRSISERFVPDIANIVQLVNRSLSSGDVGIDDIIRAVNASLNDTPISVSINKGRSRIGSQPTMFVRDSSQGNVATGVRDAFVSAGIAGATDGLIFRQLVSLPPGAKNVTAAGVSHYWSIDAIDACSDYSRVFVAVAATTKPSSGSTDHVSGSAILVFCADLKYGIPMSLIGGVYDAYSSLIPSGSSFSGDFSDVAISITDGNLVKVAVATTKSSTGEQASFANLFTIQVGKWPVNVVSALFSNVSGNVADLEFGSGDVFSGAVPGDEVCLTYFSSSASVSGGLNGVFKIEQVYSSNKARVSVVDPMSSISGNDLRYKFTDAGGMLSSNTGMVTAALSKTIRPDALYLRTASASLFSGEVFSVDTASLPDGSVVFVNDTVESFVFGSWRSNVYVSWLDDSRVSTRRISIIVPTGSASISQQNVPGFGNKYCFTVTAGSISSNDHSLPMLKAGTAIKFISGANSGSFDINGKQYTIRYSGQRKVGNTRISYYYLGDVFTQQVNFPGSVALQADVPRGAWLSPYVAASIRLLPSEAVTAIHAPTLWSSYPRKSSRHAYACTNLGRVFRTIDGGLNWEEIDSPARANRNLAQRPFPLNCIFVFHSDDPQTVSATFSVVDQGAKQYRLTAPIGTMPLWWPFQAFEIVTNSGKLTCVRADIIVGGSYTFTRNTTTNQDVFDFVVVDGDPQILPIGSSTSVMIVPLPEVIAGGDSGLLIRRRPVSSDSIGFKVLNADRTNRDTPRDFSKEDNDPDFWRFDRIDRSSSIRSISFDVVGAIGSSNLPITNVGGNKYMSTKIGGLVLRSNGRAYAIYNNWSHSSWVDVNINQSSFQIPTGVVVQRNKAPNASDAGFIAAFAGSNKLSIGQSNSPSFTVSIIDLGGFTSIAAATGGTDPNVTLSLSPSSSPTNSIVPGDYVSDGTGYLTNSGVPIGGVFSADANGNVYYSVAVDTNSDGVLDGFVTANVFVVPGSITKIACNETELTIAGNDRDGSPVLWRILWGSSGPISYTQSTGDYTVNAPVSVVQVYLPSKPESVSPLEKAAVGTTGALLIAVPEIYGGNVILPGVLATRAGYVLLSVLNIDSKSIDIYRSSGPGRAFFRISSIMPPQADNQWPSPPGSSGPDKNFVSKLPRPRLVETDLGEIVLQAGDYFLVSVDGGNSWHSQRSDVLQLPIPSILTAISSVPVQTRNFSTAAFACFGMLGIASLSGGTQPSVDFYFARSLTDTLSALGYPVVTGRDIWLGVGGLMANFVGDPADGDRFTVELRYTNGPFSLGSKFPSVQTEIATSTVDTVEVTWDRSAAIYGELGLQPQSHWNVDSAALINTNFTKAKVRLSRPSYSGSTPPTNPSDYIEQDLSAFVLADGTADPNSSGTPFNAVVVGNGVISVASSDPTKFTHGVFANPRRSYYAAVIYSGTAYVYKIIGNTSKTLMVSSPSSYPIPQGASVTVYLFSDRMFSVLSLAKIGGSGSPIDVRTDLDGSLPYRFCRYVSILIPPVSIADKQFVYGSKFLIGVAAHGVSTPYGNYNVVGERRHKFSRGFSFKERYFRSVKESDSGVVSVSLIGKRPRLELQLEYDDALWVDRDITLSSILPALVRPVCLVLDSSDSQTAEWVELVEEPSVKNTFGDRYSWGVSWREVV